MERFKKKDSWVEAIQLSAQNFDRVCDFLGCTPVQIHNPMFHMDETGTTNDTYVGIWVPTYPDMGGGDTVKCALGDVIVRQEGSFVVMSCFDFVEMYDVETAFKEIEKERYQPREVK